MRVRNLKGEVVDLPDTDPSTSDDGGRLTRIERRLMETEYLLDSTVTHVRNKGCDDIKPRSLARIQKAVNALRGGITMIRLEAGIRHPTLFAGSANPANPRRPQGQKRWGTNRAHGWGRDCEEEDEDVKKLNPEIEVGLEAECWYCDGVFVKEEACETCGFYRCPHCGKCACELDDFTRQALEKTVRAMAGRTQRELSET